MAPGLFIIILHLFYYRISFTILQSLLSNLYNKIPKIFILLLLLSLLDHTLASGLEGIDNPFIALVARFLFVCVGMRDLRVVSYWIDTFVGWPGLLGMIDYSYQ